MAELHWNAEALCRQLQALWPGLAVEVVAETGSTSTDLLERARGAAPFAPRLLVAERQNAGRGRQGRRWHAEPGASLTFSLAFDLKTVDAAGLSLAVGVALAEALDPVTPPRVLLKWPNDLWLVDDGEGRKLGGVLIETVPLGAGRIAVVGVGLNVRPLAAHDGFASGFACAQELDPAITAPALLARVAPALVAALQRFGREGFAAFAARFAARDLLRGRSVGTSQPDFTAGVADGVTARGELIVRTPDGALKTVSSGEVSVRLAATGRASSEDTASSTDAASTTGAPSAYGARA